jgi:integrase
VLTIEGTLLQNGGRLVAGTPKTKSGNRRIYLGPETAELLREHRRVQLRARMRAGEAWQDDDLIFCRDDGRPWNPDYVSRRFRRLAAQAGVPVIKLHEARHSAISLMRDAGVDPDIRRREAGHADQAISDRYTHIMNEAHLEGARAVEALVSAAGSTS